MNFKEAQDQSRETADAIRRIFQTKDGEIFKKWMKLMFYDRKLTGKADPTEVIVSAAKHDVVKEVFDLEEFSKRGQIKPVMKR